MISPWNPPFRSIYFGGFPASHAQWHWRVIKRSTFLIISCGKNDWFLMFLGEHVIWVNYNELTTSSLEIIVSKGNHPQMAQQFRLVNYYILPRCYRKTTIVWMGQRNPAPPWIVETLWRMGCLHMFTIYQLVITGFRWPIHPMLVGNSMVLGGQIFPWGTSIHQRFEGTSDGFQQGISSGDAWHTEAFWGLDDCLTYWIVLDIDWI